MENKKKFSYDEYTDNLIISCKADDEKVKSNFAFDNFVISITGGGKIVGLEIKDVSQLLEEMKIDSSLLDHIESVKLIVSPKRDSIFIGFVIKCIKNKDQMVPVSHVPMACLSC